MKKVLFSIKPETVLNHFKRVKELKRNHIGVLCGPSSVKVFGPTKTGKNKDYHRVQVEILIPKDAIIGEHALSNITISNILTIGKNRVVDHLISEEEK